MEFARGAFPSACNLPLLSDDERAAVGTAYRREGQAAAISLGERLVSGSVRDSRIEAWRAFITDHPEAWLYCWRGGLRSQTVQGWLAEVGVDVPRVPGGYKQLRTLCLDLLERHAQQTDKYWLLLGGRTGTGKTEVLKPRQTSIDLEGLAQHRGSAFGARDVPQPPLIGFENALAIDALRHTAPYVLLEDESRAIGRVGIPEAWYTRMQQTPVVILEARLGERCERIQSEYVDEPLAAGTPPEALHTRLSGALDRIRKRLGGLRHQQVSAELASAFDGGDHTRWIGQLLEWYYDPMYDYQLEKKRTRVIFSGDRAAVETFLTEAERDPTRLTLNR